MKKLVLASMFILCLSILAFAQKEKELCPEIIIRSPNGVTQPGDIVVFVARVETENKDIKFKWTVEPEYLTFTGQGTSEIRVQSDENTDEASVTATLTVIGLPKHCKNTDTETFQSR